MTLYDRAKKVIPGGVNSPVRALGSWRQSIVYNGQKAQKYTILIIMNISIMYVLGTDILGQHSEAKRLLI